MKRIILLFFLVLSCFFCGCMKRSLSDDEISRNFLKGVSVKKCHSIHYAFEGNHAGYSVILRVSAPENILKTIVESARDWGTHEASYAREGGQLLEPGFQDERWFDLKEDTVIHIYREEGKNGYASSFIHNYFVDWDKNVLYLEGGGI